MINAHYKAHGGVIRAAMIDLWHEVEPILGAWGCCVAHDEFELIVLLTPGSSGRHDLCGLIDRLPSLAWLDGVSRLIQP